MYPLLIVIVIVVVVVIIYIVIVIVILAFVIVVFLIFMDVVCIQSGDSLFTLRIHFLVILFLFKSSRSPQTIGNLSVTITTH